MSIQQTESILKKLNESITLLLKDIDKIQIGSKRLFPFGWRKAAKGRTVWRILEEIITQNIEYNHQKYNFSYAKAAESEVGVYDLEVGCNNISSKVFINIKSAVINGRKNKDDISKALSLESFFTEDIAKELFVITFYIEFKDDMTIVINKFVIMPIGWIPDIYVNPSNNGNLQSSEYKDIAHAIKRENKEFLSELKKEIKIANKKKRKKTK